MDHPRAAGPLRAWTPALRCSPILAAGVDENAGRRRRIHDADIEVVRLLGPGLVSTSGRVPSTDLLWQSCLCQDPDGCETSGQSGNDRGIWRVQLLVLTYLPLLTPKPLCQIMAACLVIVLVTMMTATRSTRGMVCGMNLDEQCNFPGK